ncbi:MAG: DUF4224 domain-containing protein [Pseudomonadota bacterium]
MLDADLTDAEIENICRGLKQNAAKVRFLRNMNLTVRVAADGRPLVNRKHYDGLKAEPDKSPSTEPAWTIPA